MTSHLITAVVAGVVSAVTAFGVGTFMKPTPARVTINAPVGMTDAQARRLALTKWPELEQAEVEAITTALRKLPVQPPGAVKVLCFDETKCGDLTSNLENAFESAHASIEVRYTSSMIPPGFTVSSKALLDVLGNAGTKLGATLDPEPEEGTPYILIGEKPRS